MVGHQLIRMGNAHWRSTLTVLRAVVIAADSLHDHIWSRPSRCQLRFDSSSGITRGVKITQHQIAGMVFYWHRHLVIIFRLGRLCFPLRLQCEGMGILQPCGQFRYKCWSRIARGRLILLHV